MSGQLLFLLVNKFNFIQNKFQTSEESLSFLSELMNSFHDENDDKPSKDQFIQKFIAYIESDKNLVWDNLMKVYDEGTVIRYKKKLDTTQVRNWIIDEVCSWLISIQFFQYQDIFKKHEIDGASLFNIYFEDQDLFQNDEDYQKVFLFSFFFIPKTIFDILFFFFFFEYLIVFEEIGNTHSNRNME